MSCIVWCHNFFPTFAVVVIDEHENLKILLPVKGLVKVQRTKGM